MRKVVDSNFLRSPALRVYLAQSAQNFVVLTDYACMEAYKGNTLTTVLASMQILREFPKQVVLLKGTMEICGLSGRPSGLQRRMIDVAQTRQFPNYCSLLPLAERGNLSLQRQLLRLGASANAQMDRLLTDASTMRHVFEDVAASFAADERKILRVGSTYTESMHDKITAGITALAAHLFDRHPRVTKIPPAGEATNMFIFRLSLCSYLMALRWVAMGGSRAAKLETIRNDMVDVSFAAYATYFDGLMTGDKKLAALYRSAASALKTYFGVVSPELLRVA